ncbi:putative phytochrome sensor protein [Alicycliphilus sp. B1]|nr:putative phytochrome sensor protein [Alicycliphilus sp. B1]
MALAFAVDPGWSLVLWTIGLIAVLELISNNVVEPWLYGASTGLSVMSLIVSATFWTALWGPVGLVMSTAAHRVPAGRGGAICRSSPSWTCCWAASLRSTGPRACTSACWPATRTRPSS